jgi:hypothetical protein
MLEGAKWLNPPAVRNKSTLTISTLKGPPLIPSLGILGNLSEKALISLGNQGRQHEYPCISNATCYRI